MAKSKRSMAGKAAIGAGLAAAAVAAAAGTYFLYGKNGARHRRQVKSWALKAKAEVLERLERLKTVSEREYVRVVNDVMKRYRTMKQVSPKELQQVAGELRRHWRQIHREVSKAVARKPRRRKATRKKRR